MNMVHESTETRLARIEEGLVSLHRKGEERHKAIMRMLEPVVLEVKRHHLSIELIKRDKRWIYGIFIFIGSAVGIVAKVFAH